MKDNIINIKRLIEGKSTYPTWTTGSTHILKTKKSGKKLIVYYKTKSNRKISRLFPKEIKLTSRLIYSLGILIGEGATSIGKSNYRRFTLTNSNPRIIKVVLDELDRCGLFKRYDLNKRAINLFHHKNSNKKVINYWSKNLDLPGDKFICYNHQKKTSPFGVCHVYISDVLLRRVVDLIQDKFL